MESTKCSSESAKKTAVKNLSGACSVEDPGAGAYGRHSEASELASCTHRNSNTLLYRHHGSSRNALSTPTHLPGCFGPPRTVYGVRRPLSTSPCSQSSTAGSKRPTSDPAPLVWAVLQEALDLVAPIEVAEFFLQGPADGALVLVPPCARSSSLPG